MLLRNVLSLSISREALPRSSTLVPMALPGNALPVRLCLLKLRFDRSASGQSHSPVIANCGPFLAPRKSIQRSIVAHLSRAAKCNTLLQIAAAESINSAMEVGLAAAPANLVEPHWQTFHAASANRLPPLRSKTERLRIRVGPRPTLVQ